MISNAASGRLPALVYGDPQAEGRALAWAGSVLFGVALAIWSSLAYLARRFLQGIRERAATNWQTAAAQITTGNVNVIHGRFLDHALAMIGYAYHVEGTYYSGYLTRQFWDEQRAWTFVDGCRDKPVLVHYRFDKPQNSVLLYSDLALCAPVADLRPPSSGFNPFVAILWTLRDFGWIEKRLRARAAAWPSVPATVEYAEPTIAGDDDTAHWVGDLHFSYTVDGNTYSNSPVLQWYRDELRGHGGLRWYAAVQIYSALVLLIALLLPARYTRSKDFAVVFGFYLLAKILETADRLIFTHGHIVSGHTLKHFAAAAAGWWILRMLQYREPCRTKFTAC